MPELLWKAYIDFEIEERERELARALYDRLVELSGHVKVWVSYAQFEAAPIPVLRAVREEEWGDWNDGGEEPKSVPGDAAIARQVFERGYKDLKRQELTHESNGTLNDVARVENMMPIVSKKQNSDQQLGQEVEDWQYVFPDDEGESNVTSFKFLKMAHAWKTLQPETPASSMSLAKEKSDKDSDVVSSDRAD